MFIFKVYRADGIDSETFRSAVSCAKECIESVLDGLDPSVSVTGDVIHVTAAGLTAAECKKKISGCFCDADGHVYHEFLRVELQQ